MTLAQARPDFSGTWRYNQGKSNPNTAGNTPNIAFPSQIVVKQTATEISVDSTSVRQQPVSAVYKLDGSKVTVQAPSGISETGEAKIDGGNLVITSRRSFSSPAGDIVIDFKEVWTLTRKHADDRENPHSERRFDHREGCLRQSVGVPMRERFATWLIAAVAVAATAHSVSPVLTAQATTAGGQASAPRRAASRTT